ncbi:imelysin family protein [Bordetella trematum]|uniref:imelysin family protein n=1 Tax=Bordetella trematum TaxID=123899 RepID=UPI000D9B6A94|nr:imelysin family protein [Bordetella trematum]SPU54346.1 Predicted periplasmic lipoprotein [Bordetella trematum]VDH02857.1 Predicted periplasmic lipoprotein [Bordetella trematum]
MKSSLVLAAGLLAIAGVRAEVPPDLGQRLADGYARTAFAELQQRAGQMQGELKAWCGTGGQGSPARVEAAFGHLVQAWGGVAFLRFGPLVQGNRFERLSFWPDPRGVMPRQVQAVLKAADPALLAEGALAQRSVAVQGLPALEYVLYGEPGLLRARMPAVYSCDYAVAVAGNVSGLTGELVAAWSPQGDFGRQFTAPAAANDLYRSSQEVAAEAMKALSTGLQFARDVQLLPVLGASAEAAKPKRAAFWRSGQSMVVLAAGLRGMKAFYDAGRYPLPDGSQALNDTLNSEFRQAATLVAGVPADVDAAFVQEAPRAALNLAALVIKNAKDVVDQDIAPALGVTIGFNALDGD